MTRINLLPWREELREERKKQFFGAIVVSVVVAVSIMLATHFVMAQKIEQQTARNQQLQNEIQALNLKITEIRRLKKLKAALITRMNIIHELQTNRTLLVHLFYEVVQILPKGVHLTKMVREGDLITLTGMAESNTNVSNLMRKIEGSKWVGAPDLSLIKRDNEHKQDKQTPELNEFSLTLRLLNPYYIQSLNGERINT